MTDFLTIEQICSYKIISQQQRNQSFCDAWNGIKNCPRLPIAQQFLLSSNESITVHVH